MHLPSLHHMNSNIPLCHQPEIQQRLMFHCHLTKVIIFKEIRDKPEVKQILSQNFTELSQVP